ncbi:hypothetical protein [Dapis sp. BLCC M229]|uniref:hypothetical protein n=1 Tax=Dapis sp. BLCC M229 TaxID=3400188 RepID=UPI003CEC3DC5
MGVVSATTNLIIGVAYLRDKLVSGASGVSGVWGALGLLRPAIIALEKEEVKDGIYLLCKDSSLGSATPNYKYFTE